MSKPDGVFLRPMFTRAILYGGALGSEVVTAIKSTVNTRDAVIVTALAFLTTVGVGEGTWALGKKILKTRRSARHG